MRGLTKTYGPVTAVDDVSLDVADGEFLTLLGPSGSGKTTLLMMIAGFTEPTTGEVMVDERAITTTPPERRNFGMVFQGYALFPHMTVVQNVAYPLRVRRTPRNLLREKVRDALALVRLDGLADRLPRQLSGGQQQRVAIARALVFSPDVLLLDEPLGALDRQLRAEVQVELKALHTELGATFVYVTHDQEEALSMSDRVAIVHRGRIEQVGAPEALYERPRTRFVAGFLGRSNFLSGRVASRSGDMLRLLVRGHEVLHRGRIESESVLLAIRPEKIALSLSEPLLQNRTPGRVTATAYLGSTLQADIATETFGTLRATCLAWTAPALAPGSAIWLGWPADATVALDPEEP